METYLAYTVVFVFNIAPTHEILNYALTFKTKFDGFYLLKLILDVDSMSPPNVYVDTTLNKCRVPAGYTNMRNYMNNSWNIPIRCKVP